MSGPAPFLNLWVVGRPTDPFESRPGLLRTTLDTLDVWLGDGLTWPERRADLIALDQRWRERRFTAIDDRTIQQVEGMLSEPRGCRMCEVSLSTGLSHSRGQCTIELSVQVGWPDPITPSLGPQPPVLQASLARDTTERSRALHADDDLDFAAALATAAAETIDPAFGFATFDPWSTTWMPLSLLFGPYDGRERERTDRLFAYDWLQYLTPEVLDVLAAHDRDMADLPAEYTKTIDLGDGRTGMLAAASRSPYQPDEGAIRRFRNFVEPALIRTGPPGPDSFITRKREFPDAPTRPTQLLPEDWDPPLTADPSDR